MSMPRFSLYASWLPALVWAVGIYFLLTKEVHIDPDKLTWLPAQADKVVHFGLFAGLAWLIPYPLCRSHAWSLSAALWTAFLVASLYGLVTEGLQALFPHRTASLYDVLTNTLGAATVFAWTWWNRLCSTGKRPS